MKRIAILLISIIICLLLGIFWSYWDFDTSVFLTPEQITTSQTGLNSIDFDYLMDEFGPVK